MGKKAKALKAVKGKQMFTVYLMDNFNFTEEEGRYELATYKTFDEAVAACKKKVDAQLEGRYEKGMSANKLYEAYKAFGESPFIVTDTESHAFWSYARGRCGEICASKR